MTETTDATFYIPNSIERREPQSLVDRKIHESADILATLTTDPELKKLLACGGEPLIDAYINGELPRISPYDTHRLPEGAQLVPVSPEQQEALAQERAEYIAKWNHPALVVSRLTMRGEEFVAPTPGRSVVMDKLEESGTIVGFDDLRVASPVPEGERKSREVNYYMQETTIMGERRLAIALGSVPDVNSIESVALIAKANGLAFASRDKVLAEPKYQAKFVGRVIEKLRTDPLPVAIAPDLRTLQAVWSIKGNPIEQFDPLAAMSLYESELRDSWVRNVGAAIDASPKGIDRALTLYDSGCRLFRIYSPEGGEEIVQRVRDLKREFGFDSNVKIVAGQIMHPEIAEEAQDEGADAIMIGVGGGRQCTTSKKANIPVDTPNLLYRMRGRIKVPIGIEGGAVDQHTMTAYVLGASFACKPGELGISMEGVGGKWVLKNPNNGILVPYGGEASDGAKWWRAEGRPRFIEGETGIRRLDPKDSSMARNIDSKRDDNAVALTFQRADTIEEIHQRDASNIRLMTPASAGKSDAYGLMYT